MEPVSIGMGVLCFAMLGLSIYHAMEIDKLRTDTRNNSLEVQDETDAAITDILNVVSNALETIPTNVPSFDSLKALEERITDRNRAELKALEGRTTHGTAVVLTEVFNLLAVRIRNGVNSGVPIATVVPKALADMSTAISRSAVLENQSEGELVGIGVDELDSVLRGTADAATLARLLKTPYAQDILRGILGGSDQVL